ncbi:ciliary microtubule associated protein 1A [Hydra vulgaris]|uniref:Ciliary microtubule associated protein 1A n=1 Tax=Hydra vulgaris TaxID=6087 RepID=A0ABM4DDQ7_HYDVU|nr:outer dense fiber protein 3-like [Hydra vulgaris]
MSEEVVKKGPIIAARETGPGPGRYALPSTCGYHNHDFTKKISPAYSFGHRLGDLFKTDSSPGPGYMVNSAITRFGKDGTPKYSILGRAKDPKTFETPSPGAYSPENVHPPGERHAPAYSMAARTRYRKRDTTPAPNSYTLPTLLGSKIPDKAASAAFSMIGRSKTGGFDEDLSKTPGPGHYNTLDPSKIKKKAPAYSMLGRSYMPGDSTQKPGPGAHCPEKVTANKRKAPSFSLGIRHSEYITPLIIDVSN